MPLSLRSVMMDSKGGFQGPTRPAALARAHVVYKCSAVVDHFAHKDHLDKHDDHASHEVVTVIVHEGSAPMHGGRLGAPYLLTSPGGQPWLCRGSNEDGSPCLRFLLHVTDPEAGGLDPIPAYAHLPTNHFTMVGHNAGLVPPGVIVHHADLRAVREAHPDPTLGGAARRLAGRHISQRVKAR